MNPISVPRRRRLSGPRAATISLIDDMPATPSPLNPRPRLRGRFRYAALIIASAAFVTSLTQALMVPLLPDLPGQLGFTASAASWLVTITLVVGAVSNPLLGRLGDQFGRKRLLLVSIAAFVLGSAICAVTENLSLLLLGRGIQGISAASIPLGIGVIAHIVPPAERAAGIALVSAMLGTGGAAGLPLAGVLADGWGLAGLFWTSAAVGAVVLIATIFLVPDAQPLTREGGVDYLGTLLLAVGVTAALVPTTQGPTWGWTSPATIALYAMAAIMLVCFAMLERRRQHPVVDVRLAMVRPILLTNLTAIALGIGFFISFLVAMMLLQGPTSTGGFGRSMTEAGLLMLPVGAAMAITAPLAGRLVTRQGPRTVLLLACLIVLSGFVVQLFPRTELWQLILSTVLASTGIAVAYSAMPALILDAAPPAQAAAASGVNALARNLGNAVGGAVFGLVAGANAPSNAGITALYVVGAATAGVAFVLAVCLPRSVRATSSSR